MSAPSASSLERIPAEYFRPRCARPSHAIPRRVRTELQAPPSYHPLPSPSTRRDPRCREPRSSHGDALGPPAATRLHDVDHGAGGVDTSTESGKLPIPEDGVLLIDRETVDEPLGERAILACGHRLVQYPFGGQRKSVPGRRRFRGHLDRGRLGPLPSWRLSLRNRTDSLKSISGGSPPCGVQSSPGRARIRARVSPGLAPCPRRRAPGSRSARSPGAPRA